MPGIDQVTRVAQVHTDLPENTLAISKLTGLEQLGKPFEYIAECVSEEPELDLYDVLGQSITFAFGSQGDKRYINGIVSNAAQVGMRGEYTLYRLVVSPWLWLLTRTSDCRIFTEMSVWQIISEVFKENGLHDFEFVVMGEFPTWNYCVQYRESDFDFVSRLMQHEGLYYYFEHSKEKHHLMIVDDPSVHSTAPEYEQIPYYPESGGVSREKEHLSNWRLERELQATNYVTNDFAFDEPRRNLLANATSKSPGKYEAYEVYEYPGSYSNYDSGEMKLAYGNELAKLRLQALSASHETVHASGDVRGISTGNIFTLTGCDRSDQNREYLVVETDMELQLDSYLSGDGGGEVDFSVALKCIDSKVNFRSEVTTHKPRVEGPQTAIVVGPKGEEIWTDKHGRVKLQFHWDRRGKSDENSSCWVRVSQAWAGEKWGSIHIPRIGQEVIVEFIDGDPDRPIVTGRVYNGDRPVPYDLPANATQSGIKSRSSKGGKPSNFNEIRMEDKKGSEELYIHAEKNQNNIVENNETTSVGNNRSENVGNNESIVIGVDREESVGSNETISIGVNRDETVGADETIHIGSNRSVTIGKNKSETITLNKTEQIGVNKAETIGLAKELTVGGEYLVSVARNMNETVGGDQSISVGGEQQEQYGKNQSVSVADNLDIAVGKKISIEAGDEVHIKTGSSSISMKKNGEITVSGKNITFKASGAINAKASKNVVIKGKKILQN